MNPGMSDARLQTYKEFWPFYLGEHSLPATRIVHFVGSWVALANLVAAVAFMRPWYLLGAVISGYAFAWVSHFFIEKNRPATFTYPGWSFISDWRMWFLMLTGKLGAELERYNIRAKTFGSEKLGNA